MTESQIEPRAPGGFIDPVTKFAIQILANNGGGLEEYDGNPYLFAANADDVVTVTETGLYNVTQDETWEHSAKILGFATASNASEPAAEYAVGKSFTVTDSIDLYIVEAPAVSEYTVSGVWVFKDAPDVSTEAIGSLWEIQINFTSYDTVSGTEYGFSAMYLNADLSLGYGSGKAGTYMVFGGWEDDRCKTVDFGTTPQTVSAEFYTWLTANATEQAEAKTVSGVWVFKETLEHPGTQTVPVSFTSNGQDFKSIAFSGDYGLLVQYIDLRDLIAPVELEVYDEGWTNEAYRTVDFGSTEQEVSDEFYTWLTSNASVKTSGPEAKTVKGKWVFNETLVPSPYFTCEGFNVSFKSNGTDFKAIWEDGESTSNYIMYMRVTVEELPSDDIEAVYYNEQWASDAYRTVDFGDDAQEVPEGFYTWFTANAVEQTDTGEDEPEENCTVSGKWLFGETVDVGTEFSEEVDFTSTNQDGNEACTYASMTVASGFIGNQLNYGGVFAYNADGWENEAMRTVDFGEDEQAVSEAFYTWLTANATKRADTGEDEPEENCTVSGKWLFGETVDVGTEFSEEVDFTSTNQDGNEACTYASMTVASGFIGNQLNYGGVFAYNADGWENEAMRTVDFGENEQAVSEAFYTWLTANATEQTDTGEDEPEEYTVSGVWVFKDAPTTPASSLSQSVVFESTDDSLQMTEFNSISVSFIEFSNEVDSIIYSTSDDTTFGHSAYSLKGGWFDTSSKTVDFGTTPQTVSAEFYAWLTANATKQADTGEDEPALPNEVISGTWIFKDTPEVYNTELEEGIAFTDEDGQAWERMKIASETYLYFDETIVYDYSGEGWVSDLYKTVTFDGEQTVSGEFYAWFTANATKQEDVDEARTLCGRWVFNSSVASCNAYAGASGIPFSYQYTEDGMWGSATGFVITSSISYDKEMVGYFSDMNGTSHVVVRDPETKLWVKDIYRNIDFGEEPITVSAEFYAWFTANATKQEDEPTETDTLTGTWIFKDTPAVDGVSLDEAVAFTVGDEQLFGRIIVEDSKIEYAESNPMDGGMTVYDATNLWYTETDRTLTFDGEVTVSAEFYAWFTANATAEETPVKTQISYDGKVIAEIAEGETATLLCSGKIAKTDIEVKFLSSGAITYNGVTTDVESGKAVTMKCAGKRMASDVAVAVKSSTAVEDYTLSGVWVFNDELTFPDLTKSLTQAISFSSFDDVGENADYTLIGFSQTPGGFSLNYSATDEILFGTVAYFEGLWTNDEMKLVDFGTTPQAVSAEFYAWFVANAAADVALISFNIDGVIYRAEEGMTFGEWCDSEYNTDGYAVCTGTIGGIECEHIHPADNETKYVAANGTPAAEADVITEGYGYTLGRDFLHDDGGLPDAPELI